MKFLLFSLLSIAPIYWCNAQKITQFDGSGDFSQIPGFGVVTTKPPKASEIQGSYYLGESWLMGSVYFGKIYGIRNNMTFRYHIADNSLEIKDGEIIRSISGLRVKSFSYQKNGVTHTFFNAENYKIKNWYQSGFFRQIETDSLNYALLAKNQANINDPDGSYIPALGVGNRPDKIIHSQDFFIYHYKTKHIIQLTGKRKKDLEVMNSPGLEKFVKDQKIKFNDEEDLIQVVKFLNKM